MSASDSIEEPMPTLEEAIARAVAGGARHSDLVIVLPGRGEGHMSAHGVWVQYDRYISEGKAFLVDTREFTKQQALFSQIV